MSNLPSIAAISVAKTQLRWLSELQQVYATTALIVDDEHLGQTLRQSSSFLMNLASCWDDPHQLLHLEDCEKPQRAGR